MADNFKNDQTILLGMIADRASAASRAIDRSDSFRRTLDDFGTTKDALVAARREYVSDVLMAVAVLLESAGAVANGGRPILVEGNSSFYGIARRAGEIDALCNELARQHEARFDGLPEDATLVVDGAAVRRRG